MFISSKKFCVKKVTPPKYNLTQYLPILFDYGTSFSPRIIHILFLWNQCILLIQSSMCFTYLAFLPYYKQAVCCVNFKW